MTKNNNRQHSSLSTITDIETLESKFSDVRGNEIMEELLAAVKEYITEESCTDGTG
jgi:hypothetical protein